MNLSVPFQVNTEVKKKLFKLKPLRRDGLLLNIQYSQANKKIRFIHCCFHETGQIIALADNDGHFYMIDFSTCKFWGLPKLDSCTLIKFSPHSQNDILAGRNNGEIFVIDCDSGDVTGKLLGHKYSVNYMSFAQKSLCLSGSEHEAIIWDLQTNTKLQVLSLQNDSALKCVVFMPVSNNILACFKDDLMQVWSNNKLEAIKQFLPVTWNNFSVRSITFSRNGQVMIIAGYVPALAIFLLDKWKLSKIVSLPEYIHTIRHIELLSQSFDGGCNKMLAILSGQGVVYFYDVEQNIILSELLSTCEIIRFVCCPKASFIACILCSGEVEVYSLSQYISPPVELKVERAQKSGLKIKPRYCTEQIEAIKSQISDMLDIDKLKIVLKEYGEYPEAHRLKIWEKLLQLPNNIKQYNSVINHVTIASFKDLYTKYPLENKRTIKCLKKLLNNMVTWCPFFEYVTYLPVFAFPFVKVFQNKPVACFEAVCTIIVNFCQHWFEYFPLAPVNVLAMIENVLMEHDPELLHHLSTNDITGNMYIWPLLETTFSEVLTATEWLLFWDHVLTNEPSFFLCAVVSYNILHRDTLLCLKDLKDFTIFYHNQNPNNTKRFLNKTYYILNNTSERNHPRQYLQTFKGIENGYYPLFIAYPKTIIELEAEQKQLNDKFSNMQNSEMEVLEKEKQKPEISEIEIQQEEKRRQKEMEEFYRASIMKEKEKIKIKSDELRKLRKLLGEEEQKIFYSTRQEVSNINNGKNKSIKNNETDAYSCGDCVSKVQEAYINQYAELLKYKYGTKELVNDDGSRFMNAEDKTVEDYQQKLKDEVDKIRGSTVPVDRLKMLNIATSIVIMENLIKNIEDELKQGSTSSTSSQDTFTSARVTKLQLETKSLEKEVSKLLKLMSKSSDQTQGDLSGAPKDNGICENKSCTAACSKTVRFSK